jgi:hypothetical protein
MNRVKGLAPVPRIEVDLIFNFNTTKGFERVGMLEPPFGGTPEFVLKQNATGTINISLVNYETEESVIATLSYGGFPPFSGAWGSGKTMADGITYVFVPSNITLSPSSETSVSLNVSAAPTTAIRSYKLSVTLNLGYTSDDIWNEASSHSTMITIVEGTSIIVTIPTTNTTSYITQTTTYTSTIIDTETTLVEWVTESFFYLWAFAATVTTAILAVFILRRSR